MRLHDVNRGIKANKKRRRIGRGPGSGHGKTSGRGHNGQRSRSGWGHGATFQGGAMPLVRRVPKRGFNNKFALTIATINIGDISAAYAAGEEVNPDTLREKSLVKSRYDQLKILGDGEIDKKLKISAHRFSKSAVEAIEKAGGEVVVIPGPVAVEEKKKAAKAAKKAAAGK